MRDQSEVEALLDKAFPDGAEGPSRYPGMTYEQGVDETLRWVLGFSDVSPMED